jgi:aromatic ring-cleaving dioxygenase
MRGLLHHLHTQGHDMIPSSITGITSYHAHIYFRDAAARPMA